MSSRVYSSFLLRLWLVSSPEPPVGEIAPDSLVLQVQNLQTGATWRLNSLSELNELMSSIVSEGQSSLLPGASSKSLMPGQAIDGPLLEVKQKVQEE